MDRYEVRVSERAEYDMRAAIDYITNRLHAPDAAEKLYSLIDDEFERLAEMPLRYAVVSNRRLVDKRIRKIPVANYLILYTVDNDSKTVDIITVQYHRRNWEMLI